MKEYYSVKEIIFGLRDYCITFNNNIVNLKQCLDIPKNRKEEVFFYMSFNQDEYNKQYSLRGIVRSTSKIKNLNISKFLINKFIGIDTGETIVSSNSDITIPDKMSKYVLDKDKFFTKVNEIINDKFIENIDTISNRFIDNIEDLPLPRTSPYLDMVSINPNGVVLSSHSLNKFLEYNARLDKVSYYGSNQSIYSSEIEAFLNVKIHKKYINEFILNIIDSNLLIGSDIIVEKFYSDVDSDVYKHPTRSFNMSVHLDNKVLYLSKE